MSSTMPTQVVIAAAARTPIGSFQGTLASVKAPDLGAHAIKAALERSGLSQDRWGDVDEVIMGCVLGAGVGQAPARQASKAAGLPDGVGCLTINKVCGSGLKAVMLAAQAIRAGDAKLIVAGGMESMSNVPYLMPKARTGLRLGNATMVDGLVHDGLWDPYNNFHMGNAAEMCAKERKIDRAAQDEYAALSYRRAQEAVSAGKFKEEIAPIEIPQRKGDPILFADDEEPGRGKIEKLPALRSAFQKEGTVTAGNASTLNDGACALVVCSEAYAKEQGLSVLAKIVDYATHAQAPEWFTTAPAGSMKRLLERTNTKVDEVDFWEVNEAFSVVSLANQQEMEIPTDRINVRGGAVALGHPIGCSGARVLTTLIYTLRQEGKSKGVASLCIGGGEAVALMVEV